MNSFVQIVVSYQIVLVFIVNPLLCIIKFSRLIHENYSKFNTMFVLILHASIYFHVLFIISNVQPNTMLE